MSFKVGTRGIFKQKAPTESFQITSENHNNRLETSQGRAPKPIWKLFGYESNGYGNGGYGNNRGYGNTGYGNYYPQRPARNGRHYNAEGGGERYKAICRVHAIDSLAFPGTVGNPVCP
ncbi:hypothetical protein JTB14_018926 [Gonioctena quinquepunctata]|nr:hypothetical protein JTB14_018926 [Gonioctena quinquepunctata]